MYKTIFFILVLIVLTLTLVVKLHKEENYNLQLEQLKQEFSIKGKPSLDHSQLPALQKQFKTPQEVTETCNSCHKDTHKDIMNSAHWNWERTSYIRGKGITTSGKKNVLNNFCIGANSNEQTCAACHIGFGMNNNHFDFTNANNVDCMVCHDNSEEYMKGSAMAGYPDRNVNLSKVAQSVGIPKKINCGSCHFFGGGGNNVKHGDLEVSQLSCSRETDVHMASNGLDMDCVNCHQTEDHQISGKLYSVSSSNADRVSCEQCHTNTPHFSNILNRHESKVACQTCHIPEYAKENSTKMAWKWSDAGKLKNGQPYHEEDSLGNHNYLSIKGSFKWEKNVKPDYIWFNGTADHYKLGDSIESTPVQMNTLYGSYADRNSKIIPVKIHVGDQIYDKKYMRLIQPKLYSEHKGDSAYWKDFNWETAAEAGMKNAGLSFSGDYGFIQTEMYWPINHMVATKEKALSCVECHTREDGRLAKLTGFYLPGRDSNKWLDKIGGWLLLLIAISVGGHAAIRIISKIINNKYENQIINYDSEPDEIDEK